VKREAYLGALGRRHRLELSIYFDGLWQIIDV